MYPPSSTCKTQPRRVTQGTPEPNLNLKVVSTSCIWLHQDQETGDREEQGRTMEGVGGETDLVAGNATTPPANLHGAT